MNLPEKIAIPVPAFAGEDMFKATPVEYAFPSPRIMKNGAKIAKILTRGNLHSPGVARRHLSALQKHAFIYLQAGY